MSGAKNSGKPRKRVSSREKSFTFCYYARCSEGVWWTGSVAPQILSRRKTSQPRRVRFDPWQFKVGFVVSKMTLGSFPSEFICLPGCSENELHGEYIRNTDGVNVGSCTVLSFDPQIPWKQMVVNLDVVKRKYTFTICNGRTSDNKNRNTQSLTRVLIVMLASHLGPPCSTRRGCIFWYKEVTVYPKACYKYVRTTRNHERELVKVNQVGAWRLLVCCVTYQPVENKMWHVDTILMGKNGRAIPLNAWSSPEGSRKLRFPDFMTTAQDGGKVVSLTQRPPLPQGNTRGTHFC